MCSAACRPEDWCDLVARELFTGWVYAGRLEFLYSGRRYLVPDYYDYFDAPTVFFRLTAAPAPIATIPRTELDRDRDRYIPPPVTEPGGTDDVFIPDPSDTYNPYPVSPEAPYDQPQTGGGQDAPVFPEQGGQPPLALKTSRCVEVADLRARLMRLPARHEGAGCRAGAPHCPDRRDQQRLPQRSPAPNA